MVIDFRYHVVSLVAIFIALGLGILIGSTLVGEDIIENIAREQKMWIGKLENDYLILKKETEDLRLDLVEKRKEINFYQKFAREIKPYFVNNKLLGKQFAIIKIDQKGPYNEVSKVLEEAGAKIVSITSFMFQGFRNMDTTILLEHITNLILNGEKSQILANLEEENLIKSIGLFGEPLDGIIFINDSEVMDEWLITEIEIPMINLLKNKIPVYVIENSNLEKSASKEIKNLSDVYSIKYLDTIPGQIALILTLLSSDDDYGIKQNPQSILPLLLDKE